jgi:hypothetical protein
MTVQQGTPESAALVAIDVSKLRHALIEAPGWRSHKRLVVRNRADEFRHLAEYLHSLNRPVHITFEATGDYHRGFAHFLLIRGFQLHLASSLALARTREALHNSWDKNDPKDAHPPHAAQWPGTALSRSFGAWDQRLSRAFEDLPSGFVGED